ncbi:MAG: hypothetical protein PHN71_03580 [Candidatus Cloacimonetes bacterium]|nr:hypothetical protein [Candidatus Cloacimonadota bacterium]MDD2210386.1 hypothetical protein [Candidatus Cloacimonadota bacterium]
MKKTVESSGHGAEPNTTRVMVGIATIKKAHQTYISRINNLQYMDVQRSLTVQIIVCGTALCP